ncbi:hydroxyquinol 1,2-dioxygenase [Virgisporangium ochraceum]|uniref:Hydroxyquinol 1,2-dioxygenase n=1 Tax=Virgisporangium ochraceum TaxID=65505 RepID=A0A8J4A531_9ACTN|nr:dioxygenase [Virgisporangium ochraceum]GIJ75048.1 hydroxyquinol 1,2-dioxygenase [Virgisporangium ochraceum]
MTDDPTAAAIGSFRDTPDERLRTVLERLVTHLHAFVRDVRLTPAEWASTVDFLTAVGRACTADRQEFILLSDVLGVSSLVETVGAGDDPEVTDATVLGPFHVGASPVRANGDSIDLVGGGEPCVVAGTVRAVDGTPLPGATLDVWQCDHEGFYDVQVPDRQPPGNGRGLFTTDDAGGYRFRTVVPAPYPIPTDGPVGDLLRATRRHPYRPAHIHVIAAAAGHRPVTTHVFVAGDPYLESDAVFAVRRSLVREFTVVDDPDRAADLGVANPFRDVRFDIVLERTA